MRNAIYLPVPTGKPDGGTVPKIKHNPSQQQMTKTFQGNMRADGKNQISGQFKMASIIDSQELKSIVNGINQKDSLLNVDQTTENLRGSEVD
jgi:hypothetical protein